MIVTYHVVIKELLNDLFGGEQRRIQKWIDRLSEKNKEACGYTDPVGFIHMGVYYRPSWLGPGKWPKKSVHYTLSDEVDLLAKDQKILMDDKQFISQLLFKVISPCQSMEEVRNALPECLVTIVPALAHYRRTKEEAFTIRNDERAYRQYQQILPKLQLYTAARLIY